MSDEPTPLEVPVRQLQNALMDGATLTVHRDGQTIQRPISIHRFAKLRVTSGHLIAGDIGMVFEMADPFVRRVPPGEYDVLVSIWGLHGRGKSPSDVLAETIDFVSFEGCDYDEPPELEGVAGCLHLPTQPPVTVPMCDSGWGDGSYFSYWGLNAAGEPVVLIVDLELDQKFNYW